MLLSVVVVCCVVRAGFAFDSAGWCGVVLLWEGVARWLCGVVLLLDAVVGCVGCGGSEWFGFCRSLVGTGVVWPWVPFGVCVVSCDILFLLNLW